MVTFVSVFDMTWEEPIKPCTKRMLKDRAFINQSHDWVLIASGNIIEGIEATY